MSSRNIRTNLIWVVFAALLPLTLIAAWQINLALKDSRDLIGSRLRANAWSIAESERDPFIVSQHALTFASSQSSVRDITPDCNQTLTAALAQADGILNFVRTGRDGKARCSVLPFRDGQDMSNEPWYIKRPGNKEIYLADAQIGTISKRPVHIMVLPIYTESGEFDGTLSAGISIEQLKASLNRKKSPNKRGVALVVDGRGRPVARTDGEKFRPFDNVHRASISPHDVQTDTGEEWTYVSAPLYRDALYIVYAEPKKMVTQAALTRIWPSLLLPLLALLLTSVAIWVATQRQILRWLKKLQMMTADFARGDFRSDLDEFASAPAELAEFAVDLRNMAGSIKAQEQELRDALDTKIALTKEVNHRVKNNLQIINSLLAMQADRMTDPASKLALGQAKSRIAALGIIHRFAYEGDGSDEQGSVNMRRLLTDLCAQLRSGYRDRPQVTLECEADDAVLPADKAIPVTLFVVEAISNAFQHAFVAREPGQIVMSFTVAEEQAILRVADDGRGFVQAAADQNMGIDLIHAFADQVGGKLEINSQPSGTVLTLRFPV